VDEFHRVGAVTAVLFKQAGSVIGNSLRPKVFHLRFRHSTALVSPARIIIDPDLVRSPAGRPVVQIESLVTCAPRRWIGGNDSQPFIFFIEASELCAERAGRAGGITAGASAPVFLEEELHLRRGVVVYPVHVHGGEEVRGRFGIDRLWVKPFLVFWQNHLPDFELDCGDVRNDSHIDGADFPFVRPGFTRIIYLDFIWIGDRRTYCDGTCLLIQIMVIITTVDSRCLDPYFLSHSPADDPATAQFDRGELAADVSTHAVEKFRDSRFIE
jgi:hypothetical protein